MFSKTVELEPRFPDGHYWQGLVYMKMKETAKAKQAFLDVIRLAPQSNAGKLAADYLKIIDQ
jgi:type IV pilus assembly protein PilF